MIVTSGIVECNPGVMSVPKMILFYILCRGAAMGDQLQNMDKTILDNWLQLRVDYRRVTILSIPPKYL